jgi:hypothetical protein
MPAFPFYDLQFHCANNVCGVPNMIANNRPITDKIHIIKITDKIKIPNGMDRLYPAKSMAICPPSDISHVTAMTKSTDFIKNQKVEIID